MPIFPSNQVIASTSPFINFSTSSLSSNQIYCSNTITMVITSIHKIGFVSTVSEIKPSARKEDRHPQTDWGDSEA